ncbi:MAG: hypothetical protein WCI96_09295 [Planctomycetota bacterium]
MPSQAVLSRVLFVSALASMTAATTFASTTVILRGTAQPIVADSVFGDSHGLEIHTVAAGSARGVAEKGEVIPWDMVRAVEGQSGGTGLAEFLEIGEDLWRARIRIERGDAALAQAELAKHWTRFRDADGPTAALVAEGLLRCALSAGDLRAAADPWLACLRHRGMGIASRFPTLPPAIDASNGLLPELSPFMPASRRAELIGACESAKASGESGEVARSIVRIANGMHDQARDQAHDSAHDPAHDPARESSPALRALGLLEDIASAADVRSLDKAVGSFDRAFEEPPSYLSAWRIAAIGTCRARIARTAPVVAGAAASDRAGALGRAALEFLAVPASGLDRTGLVDAYALEEAASLLRESGDESSAAQLAALAEQKLQDITHSSGR